ncbi:hypothetical protein QR680_000033 [Steinernema hermaphroditum]|uniref:Uncharacterized protein n=1 Tax=Steinernema hermaphroditum TaxID=289476 RepID=A0AA39GT16_9BILA|nr:hypothetical protein QR680_000033 [Steinernema hermaphroditum]
MVTASQSLISISITIRICYAALPLETPTQRLENPFLHQMLQLFTPDESTTPNTMIPPYGINARRQPSEDLIENQRAIRKEAQLAMSPWAKMAEDVIGMFGTKPSSAQSVVSTLPPLPSREIAQMFTGYGMLPLTQGSSVTELANSITSTFNGDSNKAASYIDTGGANFDRFVIHENQEGENLLGLGNSMMGRWNERGLQWSNGNLRLVNMRGNNLLGSQVAVHDRSVDIPVQQWLNMASSLFDTYRGP